MMVLHKGFRRTFLKMAKCRFRATIWHAIDTLPLDIGSDLFDIKVTFLISKWPFEITKWPFLWYQVTSFLISKCPIDTRLTRIDTHLLKPKTQKCKIKINHQLPRWGEYYQKTVWSAWGPRSNSREWSMLAFFSGCPSHISNLVQWTYPFKINRTMVRWTTHFRSTWVVDYASHVAYCRSAKSSSSMSHRQSCETPSKMTYSSLDAKWELDIVHTLQCFICQRPPVFDTKSLIGIEIRNMLWYW